MKRKTIFSSAILLFTVLVLGLGLLTCSNGLLGTSGTAATSFPISVTVTGEGLVGSKSLVFGSLATSVVVDVYDAAGASVGTATFNAPRASDWGGPVTVSDHTGPAVIKAKAYNGLTVLYDGRVVQALSAGVPVIIPVADPPVVSSKARNNTATGFSDIIGASDINIAGNITATFNEAMDPATITAVGSFTVLDGATPVAGVVSYHAGTKTAVFTPGAPLVSTTSYTATITTKVTNLAGTTFLPVDEVWSLTAGPAPVNLFSAANYAILAQTTITNSSPSAITGNLGLSTGATAAITGFTLTFVPTSPPITYATATEVLGGGRVFASDMAGGSTASDLSTAVGAKNTAYTAAAGRIQPPPETGRGGGTIGAATAAFLPGIYKWTTAVSMTGNISLTGGENDVWIFQIAGTLTVAASAHVNLSGGAQAKNVFWAVAGITYLNDASHFQGIILDSNDIQMTAGATLDGRAFSTTQVTLIQNTITQPNP